MSKKKGGGKKLAPMTVLSLVRELRRGAGDPRPLSVAGAKELVPILARELRNGGEASAVVEHALENVAVVVWVGAPDEEALHTATRAGVPIVAVTDTDDIPYVLATDVVRILPGHGFPLPEIAAAVAARLGEDGTSLASRLPALRPAVCARLIESFSRRNGLIAAAVFVPGVDLPLLTLNQIRLVLRLALAHGRVLDQTRAPELLGVVGAGFGLRSVARELLDLVPVGGWAVKGSVAYAGTKAMGEAAVRYFESRAQ
jgi:uncharacterized protein (DUF697 family)